MRLTKQVAVRRLIHSAIRLIVQEEDSISIHLIIQSAEKVIIDVLKAKNIDDPLAYEKMIKAELLKDFYKVHRELYNFVKHADKDANDDIGLFDTPGENDILLIGCIIRYSAAFGCITHHMRAFLSIGSICYESMFDISQLEKVLARGKLKKILGRGTRRDANKYLILALNENPFLDEKNDDTSSSVNFSSKTMREINLKE